MRSRTRAALAGTALMMTVVATVLATPLGPDANALSASATGSAQPGPNQPGLPLTGDLRVHDPGYIRGGQGEDSYVFGTGDGNLNDGTIPIRSSPDNLHWEFVGTVWEEKPAWVVAEIPGVENLWAPEIYEFEGTYYLYYSASTFGSNRSLIGLATNTTLDPDDPDYEWVDEGKVFESFPGDGYNAIDPGIVADEQGRHWMTFGSFWSGIRMVELDWPGGKPVPGAEVLHLADRRDGTNAIEAPYILRRGDYYYLFVSFDHCCRVGSDYKIAVGRASEVTGPYVDREGVPMLEGGGTVIVGEEGTITGSGGQSVSGGLLAYHYYDTDLGPNFDFRFALRELRWSADGWPYVA